MRLTIVKKLVLGFSSVLVLTALAGGLSWGFTGVRSAGVGAIYESNRKAAVSLANTHDVLWRFRFGCPGTGC